MYVYIIGAMRVRRTKLREERGRREGAGVEREGGERVKARRRCDGGGENDSHSAVKYVCMYHWREVGKMDKT